MNKPGQIGEPSMEDILASIRKIIAEDPAATPPRPAPEAASRGTSTTLPNTAVTAPAATNPVRPDPGPLSGRLSDLMRNGPAEASAPAVAPPSAVHPLDDDLADLLDEPSKPAAPKANAAPSPFAASSAAAPAISAKPEPVTNWRTMPAGAPPPKRDLDARPVPPIDAMPATAQQRTPAPDQRAAADLGSFIPSRPAETPTARAPMSQPQQMPNGLSAAPVVPTPRAEPKLPSFSAAEPAPPAPRAPPVVIASMPPLKPAEELAQPKAPAPAAGAMQPAKQSEPSAPGKDVVSKTAPQVIAAMPPLHRAPIEPKPEPAPTPVAQTVEAKPAAIVEQAPKAAPELADTPSLVQPSAIETKADSVSVEAPVQAKTVDPVPVSSPSAVAAAPLPAPTSAADALGALAAGLAKVNASTPSDNAATRPEAMPPLTRTVFADPEYFVPTSAPKSVEPAATVPAPVAVPPVAPIAHALPSTPDATEAAPAQRTMEDTVAELLRPLLKQWLADNMPRIVEKALRIELASSLNKPPHSK